MSQTIAGNIDPIRRQALLRNRQGDGLFLSISWSPVGATAGVRWQRWQHQQSCGLSTLSARSVSSNSTRNWPFTTRNSAAVD